MDQHYIGLSVEDSSMELHLGLKIALLAVLVEAELTLALWKHALGQHHHHTGLSRLMVAL